MSKPKSAKKAPPSRQGAARDRASIAVDPHDHLSAADAKLAAVIARSARCPFPERARETHTAEQAFHALVRAIVAQQLSGKAADTIFGRVEALGGGSLPGPAALLAVPDETLRAAGLSGAKTRGVKDLAARVASGSLKLDALHAHDDEAVIEALTQVKGIGRWTAEMFLMFRLGRLDVMSAADLGLRKGMMHLFGLDDLPDAATMERLSAPWRPFRSVGCWYLWRVAEEQPPHRKAAKAARVEPPKVGRARAGQAARAAKKVIAKGAKGKAIATPRPAKKKVAAKKVTRRA